MKYSCYGLLYFVIFNSLVCPFTKIALKGLPKYKQPSALFMVLFIMLRTRHFTLIKAVSGCLENDALTLDIRHQ